MSFPRYERYKTSGVKWLGEIPEHWGVVQSRRLFSLRNESARVDDEQLTASQKLGIIPQTEFMRREGRAVVRVIHGADILKHVEPGDFVISMRSFQGGIERSLVGGSISSAYVMLKPSQAIEPAFFQYLFKSQSYIQALQSTSNLVRDGQALRFENFTLVTLPRPDRSEQCKIASFLDQETAKIDYLIREQQRLIDLLSEKRQAVILHAVTRGLDSTVAMKASGVEWLGAVPHSWAVAPLRHRYEVALGKMLDEKKDQDKSKYPYLRNADVQWDRVNLDGLPAMPFDSEDRVRYALRKGDLLVCEGGELGRTAQLLSDLPGVFYQKALHRLRPLISLLDFPRFLFYALWDSSERGRFVWEQNKATIGHLPAETLKAIRFAFPPLAEQQAIVCFLDSFITELNLLVATAQSAIALLQERRSALISAAVTGKIDVRNYAPSDTLIPDELSQPA